MVYVWGPACGRGRALVVEIYDLFKTTGAPGSGAPGGTLGPRGSPPSEQLSRDFAGERGRVYAQAASKNVLGHRPAPGATRDLRFFTLKSPETLELQL